MFAEIWICFQPIKTFWKPFFPVFSLSSITVVMFVVSFPVWQLLFFILLLLVFYASLAHISHRLSLLSSPAHLPPLLTTAYYSPYPACSTHLHSSNLSQAGEVDAGFTCFRVLSEGGNTKWHFYMSDMFLCCSTVFTCSIALLIHLWTSGKHYN